MAQEFYEFTKSMTSSGPDTFFKRVGTSAVIRTAFIPGVTHLLQRVTSQIIPLRLLESCQAWDVSCISYRQGLQWQQRVGDMLFLAFASGRSANVATLAPCSASWMTVAH